MANRAAQNQWGKPQQKQAAKAWAFLVLAILTEVTASLSLKGALDNPALYLVVVVGYTVAFASLAEVLRAGLSLGVAYGVWGASGVALTAVASMIVFGEPMTPLMGLGIVLIIAGVVCIELGAQADNRNRHASRKPAVSSAEPNPGAKGGAS